MNFLLLNVITLTLLGISIVHAESPEVKDVRSLIGKLSRENHLSRPSCNCETKGLSRSRIASKVAPMCEEERKQRLNEAIERLKQFLGIVGHVDSFLAQKTNGLIKMMGKAVEGELEEDYGEYEMPKQLYRRNTQKYWPYAYPPPPPPPPPTVTTNVSE